MIYSKKEVNKNDNSWRYKMKNIYICGIPRSGKTTLTKKIKERYPNYNLFSFEAIRNAFIESQPNLNMENRNSQARKEILPKHFITFAKWNTEITGNPSLIEGSFCNIKELKDLIEDDSVILCLGLGCINIDEFAKNIIKYDQENDYTKKWSLEKIKKHFYNQETIDKLNYNYCKKMNIKYYNTNNNREEILNKIINELDKFCN